MTVRATKPMLSLRQADKTGFSMLSFMIQTSLLLTQSGVTPLARRIASAVVIGCLRARILPIAVLVPMPPCGLHRGMASVAMPAARFHVVDADLPQRRVEVLNLSGQVSECAEARFSRN